MHPFHTIKNTFQKEIVTKVILKQITSKNRYYVVLIYVHVFYKYKLVGKF